MEMQFKLLLLLLHLKLYYIMKNMMYNRVAEINAMSFDERRRCQTTIQSSVCI